MGRIVKKVALFYDVFATFIVFVDVHIHSANHPPPPQVHKHKLTMTPYAN